MTDTHALQSTWYHSHFALQAWEGVFGGIVINGPASANYDEDLGKLSSIHISEDVLKILGLLFLNDWSHEVNGFFDELLVRSC